MQAAGSALVEARIDGKGARCAAGCARLWLLAEVRGSRRGLVPLA